MCRVALVRSLCIRSCSGLASGTSGTVYLLKPWSDLRQDVGTWRRLGLYSACIKKQVINLQGCLLEALEEALVCRDDALVVLYAPFS